MRVNIFVNSAACDSFQFVWNGIFCFVPITCNARFTDVVPTESKLPVPVDLAFFFYTFASYSIYRCSIITVVQILLVSIFWDLIFDLLKCVLCRSLYVLTI